MKLIILFEYEVPADVTRNHTYIDERHEGRRAKKYHSIYQDCVDEDGVNWTCTRKTNMVQEAKANRNRKSG